MKSDPDSLEREIIPEAEITPNDMWQYTPLTDEEEALLRPMTFEQREAWRVANLPTRERLARYLEQVGVVKWLVDNARDGMYDDFHENGHPTPKMKLASDLHKLGRFDVVRLVVTGVFDNEKHEAEEFVKTLGSHERKLYESMVAKKQPDSTTG